MLPPGCRGNPEPDVEGLTVAGGAVEGPATAGGAVDGPAAGGAVDGPVAGGAVDGPVAAAAVGPVGGPAAVGAVDGPAAAAGGAVEGCGGAGVTAAVCRVGGRDKAEGREVDDDDKWELVT